MRLPAPAKLNLFLNITGRRADGYHELQTAFQLIDLCDWLTFEPHESIIVDCPGIADPMEQNLAWRAAARLREQTGSGQGVRIRVEKHIPAGGGLGGGSSDAATVLVALNRLWGAGLDVDALAALGLTLGADVPVFIHGRSAWGEGIGEKLQAIDLPRKWFVVVHPGFAVPTPPIFAHPDLTRDASPITIARFLRQGAGNSCEPVVRALYPAVDEAVLRLGQLGSSSAGPARLTGTGACVFMPVDTEDEARRIAAAVPDRWSVFVARGINSSPLIAAVDREIGASPSW